MSNANITERLAQWLDTMVIAEHIIEELADVSLTVTLELAQKCWEDFLMCELHHGLQTRAEVLSEKQSDEE